MTLGGSGRIQRKVQMGPESQCFLEDLVEGQTNATSWDSPARCIYGTASTQAIWTVTWAGGEQGKTNGKGIKEITTVSQHRHGTTHERRAHYKGMTKSLSHVTRCSASAMVREVQIQLQ